MSEILERELRETDLGAALLDEMYDFVERYVSATPDQLTAIVLYAAATHIIDVCVTFPRLLFASEKKESGKTLAMTVTRMLSSRNFNATGTGFGLDARLLLAEQEPEKQVPTVFKDEVSSLFGRDGFGGNSKDPFVTVLREGYKRGATATRSRRGVPEEYSIYVPVIMAGLGTALPDDIRSRTIVITMEYGKPSEYYDIRDAEPAAKRNGAALGQAVRVFAEDIGEFRARSLGVRGLVNRKAEVWEPLFAVASCMGGQRWLNKAITAFRALALAEIVKPVLTERQRTLQAAAEIAPSVAVFGFVPSLVLGDEMHRGGDEMFSGRGALGCAKKLSNAMPVDPVQRQLPSGDRMKGYYLNDILAAWEAVKPADLDEEEFEEEDPFAIDEDEDCPVLEMPEPEPEPSKVARVTGVNGANAPTQPLPSVPQAAVQALANGAAVCKHPRRKPENRCSDCPLREGAAT